MEETAELLHKLVLNDSPPVEKVTACFRSLRNTCASSPAVQSELGKQDSMLTDAYKAICLGLSAGDNEAWTICLRISAQFLGNLIVNNPTNRQIVWARFCSQLKQMALHGDEKLTNICMMVLYNIVLGLPNLLKELDQEFFKIICESGAEGMEFSEYIVELMLGQDIDWSQVYNSNVSISGRLFLLEVLEERLRTGPGNDAVVPVALTHHLAAQFCQHSECILRTVADGVDSLQPVEVATLLQVLASSSSKPPHLTDLQQYQNFFINCAFLLKSIHMAGKQGENCFSAMPKLSAAPETTELQSHPAFGFKANLIRVLGNLCWKHNSNQDLLRDVEIIPLLLDCCNIDARNPFIIQWVVLAVRNLCEDNLDNQSVIANMTRKGLVQSSVLTELGITLHTDADDNTIRIVPLDLGTGAPKR